MNRPMTTKINRSALLPYPAQALFDMVNDVQAYPEFLPWCSAAKILEADAEQMKAELTVAKAGLSHQFTTQNRLVPGKRIEMRLVKGPFSHLHGVWTFQTLTDEASKISLDLEFDYSGFIMRATLGPLFNHAANTMVDAFCQRAQQLYG
ncbi:ribosome-associated toxin RatA of RatAB toxin-antitoxin module [Thiopseudomonas denitrificans]|uniref:Ribosome-associated toxin RatA of RatAB toxin-antitoxin module n=2 Tax=Thiopseudomonas denitrificans TaxID=1501432 RepID=A0A4V3D4P6_9GAMM|nr:ribosome-associated toxin RatA of RatAB toxin-antitoxin module [Thiopseudomonas denitrificans]